MIPLPHHPGLTKRIGEIKGVGPQTEQALRRCGYHVIEDLLTLTPIRYQDRRTVVPLSRLTEGQEALTWGRIEAINQGYFGRTGRRYYELTVSDGRGQIAALWFTFPSHIRDTIQRGMEILLFGRVQAFRQRLQLVHPELVIWPNRRKPTPEVRPVYPEVDDIKQGILRRIVGEAVRDLAGLPAIFPKAWLESHGLIDPIVCLKTIHNPPADRPGPLPKPRESRAWQYLAMFEFLLLELAINWQRTAAVKPSKKNRLTARPGLVDQFLDILPFTLTESQQKVLDEITRDMSRPEPMARLLQGDVGSGKTLVALAAAVTTVQQGRQAVIMVPTEILARQHFQTIKPYARSLGFTAELLVGKMPEEDKDRVKEGIASGHLDLVVGTHALISTDVVFKHLGLAIIDEQHRFGVTQRVALRSKSDQAHILVMTATPIPRTLAMTLYGDLTISVIRGLPPGRQPVETKVFVPEQRQAAYNDLSRELYLGGQAYIVAPRIDAKSTEDGQEDMNAAQDLYDFIRNKVLRRYPVGLLHGRMKPEEQQPVITAFKSGRIRALVATTIIEVGLDVANASMMIIEGADRFGLAQLHQLRGRVGRRNTPAKCLLISSSSNQEFVRRLHLVANYKDGFTIAEEDLKLRGPGDHLGWKQSGQPPLFWARLPKDLTLLQKARELARNFLEQDPELTQPSHKLLREVLTKLDQQIQKQALNMG